MLLVVPLAPEETPLLSLAEWDELKRCERVFFERPTHPLADRLRVAGIEAGPFDDDPPAGRDGWGLVTDPDSPRVLLLAREGARVSLGLSAPDDLSAAHAAPVARRAAASLGALAVVMARLRSEDGCPWDREQTHDSLKVHLLEEAHEVIEAIDLGRTSAELEEELGDLLLQVAFHARVADQEGRFDLASVGDHIVGKLIGRHPHVFGETVVADAAEVVRNWETIKATEKQRTDLFEDIPRTLPALLAAYKTQKRAAAAGFEADAGRARSRLDDALASEPDAESVGEALFWLVAVARAAGIDPEGALLKATSKFRGSLDPPANLPVADVKGVN